MALNAKQKIFVAEYLVDKNGTRAAKAAGYSEKTAYSMAHENLRKPEIAAAIEKGIRRQIMEADVAAAKKGITKERWLEELALIATANMDDHARVVQRKVKNGSAGGHYIVTDVIATPSGARPRDLGRVIKKLSETKNGIAVELHSKQAALDTLGKAFGWVKDQIEMTGKDGGPQVIVMLPSNGREVLPPPKPVESAPLTEEEKAQLVELEKTP